MPASRDSIGRLHEALCNTLATAIEKGVPVADKETGEVVYAPAPAAILAVARGFLADNHVEAPPTNTGIQRLANAAGVANLPFEGDEEARERGHQLN